MASRKFEKKMFLLKYIRNGSGTELPQIFPYVALEILYINNVD